MGSAFPACNGQSRWKFTICTSVCHCEKKTKWVEKGFFFFKVFVFLFNNDFVLNISEHPEYSNIFY